MAPSNRPIVVYAVVIILTIHVLSLMIARLKSAKIKFLPDSTLLLYIAGVILAWFSDIIDAPHETEFNDDDGSIFSAAHYNSNTGAAFTLFRALHSVRAILAIP